MHLHQLRIHSSDLMDGPFGSLLDAANILPEEKVRLLLPRAQAGDERAREQLVMHLIRMVFSTSKSIMGMWYTRLPASYTMEDACMAGMEGALGAIDAYDHRCSNGAKLSTFAALRIKSKVQRSIYKSIGYCHIPEYIILRRNGNTDEIVTFSKSLDAPAEGKDTPIGQLIIDHQQEDEMERVDVTETVASFSREMSRYGTGGDMRPMILRLAALGYQDEEIRALLPRRITRAAVSDARRSMQDDLRSYLAGDEPVKLC